MVRVAVGINVYQDHDGVERCVRSLRDGVDKVIVVDGRYPDWGNEDDPQFSTDETEELCKEQLSKLVPIEYHKLFAEQKVKRSKYLELANDCDFLLVIDADEFVVYRGFEAADWSSFRRNLERLPRFERRLKENKQHVHNIALRTEPNKLMLLGRLIYRPSELYYSSHWRLNRRTDGAETRYPPIGVREETVEGITITYDELMRPTDRLQVDVDYQWTLEYKEGDLTKEQYEDPTNKQKFLEHNIHEVRVWENGIRHDPKYENRLWLERPNDRRKQAMTTLKEE